MMSLPTTQARANIPATIPHPSTKVSRSPSVVVCSVFHPQTPAHRSAPTTAITARKSEKAIARVIRKAATKIVVIPKVSSSSPTLGTEETPNHPCTVRLVSSSPFVSLPELVAHHGNGRLDRPPLPPQLSCKGGKPDPSRDARLTVSWIREPHDHLDRANNLGHLSNPVKFTDYLDNRPSLQIMRTV